MSVTRKTCVPMPEQIRLINECRQSGKQILTGGGVGK